MTIIQTVKFCTKCGNLKPLSEFYKDKRNTDGLKSQCKTCHNSYKPLWRAKKKIK